MKFLDVPQSGSIAGTTHSHNRAGQYTRNRRAPVQPVGTGRRSTVRGFFATASAAWASLTDVQRAAWDSFAIDHPVTDSLGSSITLTGHQMFVGVNSTIQNMALGLVNTPPSTLVLPNVSGADVALDISSGITIDSISGGDADSMAAVAFSKPMSPGRTFNKTFWQPPGADGIIDDVTVSKNIATAIYAAEFGTPIAGQKTFVRITPTNNEGWYGAPTIYQVLWVA
jgi:hypothetical protein